MRRPPDRVRAGRAKIVFAPAGGARTARGTGAARAESPGPWARRAMAHRGSPLGRVAAPRASRGARAAQRLHFFLIWRRAPTVCSRPRAPLRGATAPPRRIPHDLSALRRAHDSSRQVLRDLCLSHRTAGASWLRAATRVRTAAGTAAGLRTSAARSGRLRSPAGLRAPAGAAAGVRAAAGIRSAASRAAAGLRAAAGAAAWIRAAARTAAGLRAAAGSGLRAPARAAGLRSPARVRAASRVRAAAARVRASGRRVPRAAASSSGGRWLPCTSPASWVRAAPGPACGAGSAVRPGPRDPAGWLVLHGGRAPARARGDADGRR